MYATRLSAEQRTSVSDLFKQFLGTKKYHNYTKEVKAHDMAAQRYMMELTADEYMYVNRHSFEVTDSSDPDALEFIHFYLKGQSFLFN
jgi:tRNA U38,U39,U40 pseudouridine synthase TruA